MKPARAAGSVGGKPLASIATLKRGAGEWRAGIQVARQRVFAAAVLALNGCDLDVRRGHFSLHKELAPCRADADDMNSGGGGIQFNEGEAR